MTPDPNDGVPVPMPPADTVSEQYILDEVSRGKITLSRTRIFCAVALIATIVYMAVVTANLRQFLMPAQAAELAKGMIADRVNEQGPDIAAQFRQQIPVFIAQAPDYAMQQMPIYRQNLEDQFNKDLTSNLASGSDQLEANVDDFITAHKDQVKVALASGADPTATKALGDGISQTFLTSLKTTQVNGESIQSKFDSSLASLTAIQNQMDRLANATNLTPQEKKTRHAIAILTKTISREAPKAAPATATATADAAVPTSVAIH